MCEILSVCKTITIFLLLLPWMKRYCDALLPLWNKRYLQYRYSGITCLDKNEPILRVNPAVWKSHDECPERYTAQGVW